MVVTASSHGVCSMWQQLCISGSNENSSLCMRYDNVIARFYIEDNILFTFILRSLVPQVNHAAKSGLNVSICRLCNHSSVLLRRKLHTRDVFARKRDRPTLARRTLLSPSFPVFQKESRESPLLSRDGEMIDRVVEWFETKELLRCLMWPALEILSRLFEEIVTVFDSSPRSSPKGHPRLPLDVPDVFQSVSVLQRDERARKTSKTFVKLLA